MATIQTVFECEAPVALVTGSGSARIGRAIALRLSNLGCRIALHANRSVAEAQQVAEQITNESGQSVIVTSGDLRDTNVAEGIIRQAHEHFGRIDILVNSAAIWRATNLDDITPDELREYFDVNVAATFFAARTAGQFMVNQPSGGSIVNLGDWATVRPYMDHAAYFPSKGAVESLSRSLAVELAQRNPKVRVNCLLPGPVLLTDDVPQQRQELIAGSTLLGRVGTPAHVAHAVQFLCENDFVTGVCLPIDGGRSIFAPDGIQVGLNTG